MKTSARGGSTFGPSCSVGVMGSYPASPSMPRLEAGAEALLREFVGGERGQQLRTQLADRHRQRSREEIDDAVQTACERFVESATEISTAAEVYAWIRTTAHRVLLRRDERSARELLVDPTEGDLAETPSADPDPAEQIIARQDEGELEALVGEVADSLSDRRREILALHLAGLKRAEIGERLGLSVRAVERELLKIMDEARTVLARRAGGGCETGESLILRFVYGLASSAEVAQARMHLDRCHRCDGFYERLTEWREKAAVILPAPAIEGASPGTFERIGQRVADAVGSAKQQILGTGAQVKQQTASSYYRAVDPIPLAGVRPGAVAAVVASCITISGGAAAYCANQGVDPIGAATGLIAGSEEPTPEPPTSNQPEAQETSPTPAYEPSPTPSYEPEEQTTEAPQTESSTPVQKSEPEPEPTASEPTAQVEGEFEPIEEPAPEPEPEVPAPEASQPTESAKQPAPVQSSSGAGEFEP